MEKMKVIPVIAVPFLLLAGTGNAVAQQILRLYDTVPGAKASNVKEISDSSSRRGKISHVTDPTLAIFLPSPKEANGTAVIICPGGGYSYLVINGEGYEVARALNKKGIAAFVLKYRLPDDRIMSNRSIGPLQDAEQAIRLVREHAREWRIDTAKVGVMGFSAGGHLAATLSTHYLQCVIPNPDRISLRPDFSILVYPVISFQPGILHKGSKKALIGEDADSATVNLFSDELQVTPYTPPAFLVACTDDPVVSVENTIRYFEALHKNGVNAEMHIYEHGGHGYGLHNRTTTDQWLERCFHWMHANAWL